MKNKAFYLALITFGLFAYGTMLSAQNFWSESRSVPTQSLSSQASEISKHRELTLDIVGLKNYLKSVALKSLSLSGASAKIIELPNPDGGFLKFEVHEDPVMEPALAAKFPEIKTYTAYGNNNTIAKLDVSPEGFHGMILSPEHGDIFIRPSAKSESNYICYFKEDFQKREIPEHYCGFHHKNDSEKTTTNDAVVFKSKDKILRTYRLALAANYEYSNFHGGTKSKVMSAMVTTVNRVNAIYERDVAVKLVLVANNDKLIYLSSNDPYTNGNGGTMLGQNKTVCNNIIGSANYDIGHVFSTGGGGVAGLGVVCGGNKAYGVTGSGSPVGDPFDIDYVAHEMGHQFGANHTFNNSCGGNRNTGTAYEVGSGISIMGYAGICSPNAANHSDAVFHAISLQEITNFITSGGNGCAAKTTLANSIPTASAGKDYTIPKSTPFTLKGSATDANGTGSLTYSWEQMDRELVTMPPSASSNSGPAFKTFLPSKSPERSFPRMTEIANNVSPTWEVLSNVNRKYNFRFIVRDNSAGGGLTNSDDMVLNVTANAGPFVVQSPNTAVTWGANSTQTVTWNVAKTNVAPVNCQKVNIKLSTDGGLTYPTTIISNVPNDGSQSITVPNSQTTKARIMVEAADNVFFDVSNQNFTINGGGGPVEQKAYPSGIAHAIPGTIEAEDYDIGGESIAYHDNSNGNNGNQYRNSENVDVETSTESAYNVGWIAKGEWLEYSVDVKVAGTYALEARVAAISASSKFHVEFGEVNKTGSIAVPNTTGWQKWVTVKKNVSLSAGKQIMRVYFEESGMNLNWIKLSSDSSPGCDLPWAGSNISVNKQTVNWTSVAIDISCASKVDISMDIEGISPQKMEPADYLNIYYKVDGGSQIAISENRDGFAKKSISAKGISGNSLQIIVQGKTSWQDETYNVTNLQVLKSVGLKDVDLPNGGEENIINELSVYPNPADNILEVSISGKVSENARLNVRNSNGRIIISEKLTENEYLLLLDQIDPGVYVLQIINAGQVMNKKFIKN